MKQETIDVRGMHCASCAVTIGKKIENMDGVAECHVNYGTEKVQVQYDPAKVSVQDMNNQIQKLGYTLAVPDEDAHKKNRESIHGMDHSMHLGIAQTKEEKMKEVQNQKRKMILILPITLGVFLYMIITIIATFTKSAPIVYIPSTVLNPVEFILAAFILFWAGQQFIMGAYRFFRYGSADMDALVGIGTITAFIYSSAILLFPQIPFALHLSSQTYFDTTIIVIGFILFGKYLEISSKQKTGEALEKLFNLQAKTALVKKDGYEAEVPIDEVTVGDEIIVKPGSTIPVDGVIVEGASSIDESMITGESIPVEKHIHETVIGGTINKQGSFIFKATKVGNETLLTHIISMVAEAQGSRAPIQKIADTVAGVFTPVVLCIAVITVLLWLILGTHFLGFHSALSYALLSFVGILVIACPCALGLATPTAIIVGTGKGASKGILIKNAESLEKLQKANTVVLDKTGTITKGRPEVTDILIRSTVAENKILTIAASLEAKSEHPLAEAIIHKAKDRHISVRDVENFSNREGKGVTGVIDTIPYFIGNEMLMQELQLTVPTADTERFTKEGKTPVFLATKQEVLAFIGIADTVREDAKEAIATLHNLGIKTVMLTGDHKNTAKYIADLVGIDTIIAQVLPEDKANKIKELQTHGNIVAMVGDGINDSPALALADVSIAMGNGSDIAIETADITLLGSDIAKLPAVVQLSRATMKTIKQNLFWAFIYNIIGIPLAAGLLFPVWGIFLNPAFAGFAMAFSSVTVVSNSLRLRFVKI